MLSTLNARSGVLFSLEISASLGLFAAARAMIGH